MADLIPNLTWTEFKRLKPEQLKRMKSCEVFYNCEYLFTFVNGNTEPSGFLRMQSEFKCQTSNAISGQNPEDILNESLVRV